MGIKTAAIAGWGYTAAELRLLLEPRIRLDTAVSLQDIALCSQGSGPAGFAAALDRTLEKNSRWDIIAWSAGALLALEFAAAAGERVRRLVLYAATPSFCARSGYSHGKPAAEVRAMRRALRANAEEVLWRFAEAAGGETDTLIQGKEPAARSGLAAGLEYLLQTDVRDRLERITAEVLLLHGTEDTVVPSGASGYLHRKLPHSSFRLKVGGSHCLWPGRGGAVLEETAAFLMC